ncbi:hypothetical protein NDU88_003182 [Pleurodeles waltl]|uniref:Uncharacterized protein n=1 Tax=Pleurodeles waltl TaxID=8319 RepID=A0AAV7M3T8_PLEWA|nr:hypothetical protein NDU88_003182 [Pleurodeles waltl]
MPAANGSTKLRWRPGLQRPAGPGVRGWPSDAAALSAVSGTGGAGAAPLEPDPCEPKRSWGVDGGGKTHGGGPGGGRDRLRWGEDSPIWVDRTDKIRMAAVAAAPGVRGWPADAAALSAVGDARDPDP